MSDDDFDDYYRDDDFDDYYPDDYDSNEPIGSCEWCGANIYPDDYDDELCDSCAWHAEQNRGDDGCGWQQVT